TRPAVIAHDGSSYTLSVDLTPAGCRALLGVPAAALAGTVVSLDDLLGRSAGELVGRLATAPGWPARFALLDEVLAGPARRPPYPRGGGRRLRVLRPGPPRPGVGRAGRLPALGLAGRGAAAVRPGNGRRVRSLTDAARSGPAAGSLRPSRPAPPVTTVAAMSNVIPTLGYRDPRAAARFLVE